MAIQDTIKHLFFPHHTNNHRPKILHIDALALYVIFFLFINVFFHYGHSAMPDVLGYATDIYVDQLLTATNEKRAEAGLGPLTLNSQLSQAAAGKARNMFSENYWAHNSPSGKTPWDFINSSGYRYTIAGENLAKNFMSSQSVVDAWMASPSHRDNLLKPGYREIGFAVVNGVINGEETTLVVQMFGTSASAISAKTSVALDEGRSTVKPVDNSMALKSDTITVKTNENNANPELIPLSNGSAIRSAKENSPETVSGVTVQPFININSAGKYLVYSFIIVMFMVLISDAYIIAQKRIVRVTGHNLAHFMFFSAVFIITTFAYNGKIL